MRLPAPLRIAWRRARWGKPARELRRSYGELVDERERSPEERIAHHFEHLEIYWRRIDGWAAQVGYEQMCSGVQFDQIVAVTGMVSPEVEAFAAKHGLPALRAAWDEYRAVLRRTRHGLPTPETGIARADAAFRKAREIQCAFELPRRTREER